ncbi:PREDICTED: uncharacterized protein K02A2.6-like [Wasmannia auropunctata]|uniref:uncharacterized protein K02A2.6-like n=1 Tax=Wasmannia auropunctata TaxID=64793 RepID=UPI0005EEC5E0|nr:PREDICTED: uncharacterized protein K02A2.6-like [Wasmannia auropunctata]
MFKQLTNEKLKDLAEEVELTASGKSEGQMEIYEKDTIPFQTLHIDHLGPLEETIDGYKYILVMIDAFTKFVWLQATKSTGTTEVVKHLESLFNNFGYPNKIISDRGTAFTSSQFTDYLKDNEVKHVKVAVASP